MNRPAIPRRLLVFAAFLLSGVAPAPADNGWEGHILSLTWENDAISDTDRHYTHGARVAYLSRDNALPRWARWLADHVPAVGMKKQADKLGLEAGQEIYTPEDLQNTALIPNDRPYAGWLYTSLSLQRRGQTTHAWPVMETLRLDLGIIGPEALAEEAQRVLHGDEPTGWHHQLGLEPGFGLRYDRRYLFARRNAGPGWGAHFIPRVAASAGNVHTFLGAGSLVRFGYNVPNEFHVPRGPTPLRFGVYFFGGVEGRVVGRNIFLDGNTFRSSHSVEKKLLVADFTAGCTVVLKRVELTAAYVFRTREFHGQRESDAFGSATVAVKF
jgi:hypothetical protein